MTRRIVALLTACAAAPCLTVLFMLIVDLAYGGEPSVESSLDLLKAAPLGTFALLLLGLPFVCAARLLAAILHGGGWETRWHFTTTACLLGSCFVGLVFSEKLTKSLAPMIQGGLAGAICGWIYWRIALGKGLDVPSPEPPFKVYRR
jgi:hypothetical protein